MHQFFARIRAVDRAWWLAGAAAAVALWLALPLPRIPVPFQAANTAYLEGASKKAVAMLVPVGVIKGAADVVEGSTVSAGVNFGVSGNVTVEAGDIMQPVLDVVTVIWKTLLVDCGYLMVMLGLVQVSDVLALPSLLAALLAGLGCLFARRHLAADAPAVAVLRRTTRLFALVCLLVVFVFPCTVRLTAALSRATTAPYQTAQQASLQRISRGYEALLLTGSEGAGDGLSARLRMAARTAKDTVAALVVVAGCLVAVFVLEGIVFPLLSLVFLVWFVRSCLMPMVGLGAEPKGGADLAAVAAWIRAGRDGTGERHDGNKENGR